MLIRMYTLRKDVGSLSGSGTLQSLSGKAEGREMQEQMSVSRVRRAQKVRAEVEVRLGQGLLDGDLRWRERRTAVRRAWPRVR